MGSWILGSGTAVVGSGNAMNRWVGYLAPGLPQLRRGKIPEGTAAVFTWVGMISLVLVRFDRIRGALTAGFDDQLALLTLILVMAYVWWWSYRENGWSPGAGGVGGRFSVGAQGEGWASFRKNRTALMGLWIIGALYLAMLLAPFLAPFEAGFREAYRAGGDMGTILSPPSSRYPMGTDVYSQDILSRILYGARISLTIGLVAVGISVPLGAVLGGIAGYCGGWVDGVIMRTVDMILAVPRLVLLMAIVALFPSTIFVVIVALAFTQWPYTARMVRGEILSLKEREFAQAARALGFTRRRILFRHLLPNAAGPIIVVATLGIGNAIVLEAGLSFLGLGVQAGTPSWGSMVNEGRDHLIDAWWIATFPGLAIALAVLAFNLVGDGLRDALDPRQRERGS